MNRFRLNIHTTCALIATVLLSTSCVKDIFTKDRNAKEIVLYAGMNSIVLDTKAEDSYSGGVIDSDSPFVIPVAIFRTNQSDNANYPAFTNSPRAIPATLRLPDETGVREVIFDYAQFGDGTSEIAFAGVGPWNNNDVTHSATGTTVSFTIDGSTDIIYGTPVRGTTTETFPCMPFNHALCQFNVYAYYAYGERQKVVNGEPVFDDNGQPVMETYSTYETWGKLEESLIRNILSQCDITLPNSISESEEFNIEYKGTARDIEFVKRNAGDGIELGKTFEEATRIGTLLAAPPTGTSKFLNIKVRTELEQSAKEVSVAKNFQPGLAYNIYLRFADHGQINASATISQWTESVEVNQTQGVSMYYSLSRYGTANCYMINSGNYNYSFDGTVKGNGFVSELTPDASGGPTSVALNPDHVGILWTDFDNTVTVSDETVPYVYVEPQISNGLVLVKVGDSSKNTHVLEREGNVLIAAYDSNDNIIWTWHLWLCDPVYSRGLGNGYNIQDRNLGATSNNKNEGNSIGLFYQWGRFTPISFNSPKKEDGKPFPVSVQTETTTYANAIGNPGVIYGSNSAKWTSDANEGKSTIWGYKNEYTEMKKTIYDPCPAGYMMSDPSAWDAIVASTPTRNQNGIEMTILGNQVWLPSSGYYSGTSNNGSGFHTWTAEASSTASQYFYYPTTGSPSLSSGNGGLLKPVRCKAVAKEDVFVRELSAAQTANCYIVSKTGYFKFRANVRGNGNGTLNPLSTTPVDPWDITAGMNAYFNTEGAIVRMLWWQGDLSDATWQDATKFDAKGMTGIEIMDEGRLDEDGCVTFKVGELKKGNLILAIERAGNILWSWHIWICESDPEDVFNGSYVLMDRNLGATSVPVLSSVNGNEFSGGKRWATHGFYYQWGRKDPIPGSPIDSNVNNLESSTWWDNSTGTWIKKKAITAENANTIQYVTQHPTVFFKDRNSGQIRWSTSFNNNLLGAALWGYAVNGTATGKAYSKTLYDPCPPGYKMPPHYIAYNYEQEGDNYKPVGAPYGTSAKGFVLPNANGYDSAWWPFAGKRDGNGDIQEVSDYGFGRYHTFMPRGEGGNIRTIYIRREGSEWKFGQDTSPVSAQGMSVRCLKE